MQTTATSTNLILCRLHVMKSFHGSAVYTVVPPQPPKKPGQLEPHQVQEFFDKGFVVLPSFFTAEDLAPVIEAINNCVDILATKLYNAGKIRDRCEGAGFYQRLTLIEQQFSGAAVLLHKMGYLPPAFQNLWSNERLLNVVEQLIGPDIAGHPVWNLRTKTPHNQQTTVPWHQDNAYLDPSALHTLQPTAWIPLIDANMVNGCMQVASGGHKAGITATHTCCAGNTWYVELDELEMQRTLGVDMARDVVTCEVPFGGILLLNNAVPHRSLENLSNQIRWSLDLRWQRPDMPNGFYSLKENVVMRRAGDQDYKIDWSRFAGVNRTELQAKAAGHNDEDEFDTTIHGPWMKRWEIVHHNRHTQGLKDGSSWHDQKA